MNAILAPPRPSEKIQFQLWAYKIKHWIRHGLAEFICLTVAAACLFPLVWMIASSLKTQSTVFSDMSLLGFASALAQLLRSLDAGPFRPVFFQQHPLHSRRGPRRHLDRVHGRLCFFPAGISGTQCDVHHHHLDDDDPDSRILHRAVRGAEQAGADRYAPGLILPQINGGLALGVFLLKTFFDKLPPDLEDAARIDGCNKFQVYWHVAMPLAKPAVAVLRFLTRGRLERISAGPPGLLGSVVHAAAARAHGLSRVAYHGIPAFHGGNHDFDLAHRFALFCHAALYRGRYYCRCDKNLADIPSSCRKITKNGFWP